MNNLIEKLVQEEWQKSWEGDFSMLNTISCTPYYHESFTRLGIRIDRVLTFHKKGITSCLLNKKDNEAFILAIARKLKENPELSLEWKERAIDEYQHFQQLITLADDELLCKENFEKLSQCIKRYTVCLGVAKSGVDGPLEDIHKERMVELRKETEKFFFELEVVLDKIAKAISARTGLEQYLIESMLPQELMEYLENKLLPDTTLLERRYKGCALLWSDKVTEFDTTEAGVLEQHIYSQHSDIVSGNSAFPGKVTGRVRVIINYAKDKEKFEKGEVLVTGMTDPNYLPLMKQASAIVVDTGGLLSHAAIVARELKIPCIIGTENVTKVLKDGDMVEVDAENGIVKILSTK
jgi:phosphohistidine swiveling domain-containing protein